MQLHRHTSTAADPRERGLDLGRSWDAQTRRTAKLYQDFFTTIGMDPQSVRSIAERSHEALRAWSPALAEEAEGWADGAGLEPWEFSVVAARTEILAAAPRKTGSHECSTAVYAPAGPAAPQTMQTWDWHDDLTPEGLLLEFSPAPGRTVKMFTEFGTAAKIGVNNAGLGLHFNILSHASDNDSAGVPVHAIARRILDEAGTIDEAIAIAASATVSASTVYTVFTAADVPRRAVSIEVSPAGTAVVDAAEDGWLLHTNHFLDPELAREDGIDAEALSTQRLAHLGSVAADLAGLGVAERARTFCGTGGSSAVVCFHPDTAVPLHEQWRTLLTISVDTADCTLHYATDNPAEAARTGFSIF